MQDFFDDDAPDSILTWLIDSHQNEHSFVRSSSTDQVVSAHGKQAYCDADDGLTTPEVIPDDFERNTPIKPTSFDCVSRWVLFGSQGVMRHVYPQADFDSVRFWVLSIIRNGGALSSVL